DVVGPGRGRLGERGDVLPPPVRRERDEPEAAGKRVERSDPEDEGHRLVGPGRVGVRALKNEERAGVNGCRAPVVRVVLVADGVDAVVGAEDAGGRAPGGLAELGLGVEGVAGGEREGEGDEEDGAYHARRAGAREPRQRAPTRRRFPCSPRIPPPTTPPAWRSRWARSRSSTTSRSASSPGQIGRAHVSTPGP